MVWSRTFLVVKWKSLNKGFFFLYKFLAQVELFKFKELDKYGKLLTS